MRVLFITWDGPQVTYLKSLFGPIFIKLQQDYGFTFKVLQFTWGSDKNVADTKLYCEQNGLEYQYVKVHRSIPVLGLLVTLFKGLKELNSIVLDGGVDCIMPRSTMPALITLLSSYKGKVVFDADGLPLEERVDFGHMKKNSLTFRLLRSVERRMIKSADSVLCRSKFAVKYHTDGLDRENSSRKFFVVYNGKDTAHFKYDEQARRQLRYQYEIQSDECVFIYVGSLGKQYLVEHMLNVYRTYKQQGKKASFFLISRDTDYFRGGVPEDVVLLAVDNLQVPLYLSMADVAFALRDNAFSMRAVAPIKLGEYLLVGLPTIASRGIGDTDHLIEKLPNCYPYKNRDEDMVDVLHFVDSQVNNRADRRVLIESAKDYFSLVTTCENYNLAIRY